MQELSKLLTNDKKALEKLDKLISKIMREEPKSLTRKELYLLRSILYCYSSKANSIIGSGNVQDVFKYALDKSINKA